MAQMLPAGYPADGPSEAEHQVFDMLETQLSHEWTCLHSLGLAHHRRKVWAEIDFVLVGPPGVFCIEVKGGQVSRNDGIWTFRNRHGRENTKKEGPFEQVGSAAGALRAFFRRERRDVLNSIVGFGVVMPDVPCTMRGPDVDAEVVADETTFAAGAGPFISQLVSVWTERFTVRTGRAPKPLDRTDRDGVIALLRGDFDLVPSLPTRMGWATKELVQLTGEQSDLLARLDENPRVLVRGAAGTGKTVIALEEAARAAGSGDSVLYLCFNRLLAESVRLGAAENVTVSTLHSLMSSVIRDAGLEADIPDADERDLFEVFLPVLALQALSMPAAPAPFDVLVVDEGQDVLLDNYLDVLDKLVVGGLESGRWRVFYDPNQNLFDGVSGPALDRLASFDPTRFRLTINCRNTQQIAETTSLFSGCDHLSSSVEGPKVETLWYRDVAEQRRIVSNCVKRLLSQGVRPSQIVVLSTRTLKNSCLSQGWHGDIGARLGDLTAGPVTDDGAVRFATIGAFKGLESDAVVLLDAVTAEPSSRYLTYVGGSRARVLLTILLDAAQSEEVATRYARFGDATIAHTILPSKAPKA